MDGKEGIQFYRRFPRKVRFKNHSPSQIPGDKPYKARIQPENCQKCLRCLEACPYAAISVVKKKLVVDPKQMRRLPPVRGPLRSRRRGFLSESIARRFPRMDAENTNALLPQPTRCLLLPTHAFLGNRRVLKCPLLSP